MSRDQFQLSCARLAHIEVGDSSIRCEFSLDGEDDFIQFEYEPEVLGDLFARTEHDRLHSFAASLGVLCFLRHAAVLPRSVDLGGYGPWVPAPVLELFERTVPHMWSEHRYQLGRLDFERPQVVVDRATLGSKASLPLFGVAPRDPEGPGPDVMVATGSGKDSLLCETLIREAGIPYEAFTYLADFYGEPDHQRAVFGRVRESAPDVPVNTLVIRDPFKTWLRCRMAEHDLTDPIVVDGRPKPFLTDSGEDFAASFAMVPLQVARGIGTQAYGNERSADFPNLIHLGTGEAVSHQYGKSATAQRLVSDLYGTLFENIDRVSLTKAVYDVKIFESLFALAGDLPYLTNSCNHQKPWCARCEKCLYVFAGFAAFGDHAATVKAFGQDLFQVPEVLPIWQDLLGLRGHIAWECVGHPDEAQLYVHRAHQNGVAGPAIDLFVDEVWKPLIGRLGSEPAAEAHFRAIYSKYSAVDPGHHNMPAWLAGGVLQALT